MCNYQPNRSLSDKIRDTLLTETFLNGNHMFGFQRMLRGCGKNEKSNPRGQHCAGRYDRYI